jgi:hypothetical protein
MGEYFIDHPQLGYGPKPGILARSERKIDGEIIYDTVYSINAVGRRVTPHVADASEAVLIFGGSFTLGEGVQDQAAMPYRLGELTGSQTEVHNFGFHGYGPHQMLAAMQTNLMSSATDKTVTHVIYQTIPDHVHRAAGRAFWDTSGPEYRLTANGSAEHVGSFDEGRSTLMQATLDLLQSSQLYQRMFGLQKAISAEDVQLYTTIVASARQEVTEAFPGAEFHVLLWGYPNTGVFDQVYESLIDKGVDVHQIIGVLPAYAEEPEVYQLHAKDTHPNALAHDLIARYIQEYMLR